MRVENCDWVYNRNYSVHEVTVCSGSHTIKNDFFFFFFKSYPNHTTKKTIYFNLLSQILITLLSKVKIIIFETQQILQLHKCQVMNGRK